MEEFNAGENFEITFFICEYSGKIDDGINLFYFVKDFHEFLRNSRKEEGDILSEAIIRAANSHSPTGEVVQQHSLMREKLLDVPQFM